MTLAFFSAFPHIIHAVSIFYSQVKSPSHYLHHLLVKLSKGQADAYISLSRDALALLTPA